MKLTARDFKTRLSDQLEFIESSCAAFDSGRLKESVRIAVGLRVLFHKSRTSTPLIEHLGGKDVELISTASIDDFPGTWPNLIQLQMGSDESRYHAPLSAARCTRLVSFSDWWEGEVLFNLHGKNFGRRDFVLWAANKEGAHVDEELPHEYVFLDQLGSGWQQRPIESDGKKGFQAFYRGATPAQQPYEPIPLAMGTSLRQIGFEVLNSPQFLALAR